MLKQGVIEPSASAWSSPIIMVKKKDGYKRFCVDYLLLNDLTQKNSYPLPRIDSTLEALSRSSWFCMLDLKSGYWQVEMDEVDKEKTAFSIGTGLWQFLVMPFGLCNVPATFERLVELVLRGLSWTTCLVYVDDILIHGRSFADNVRCLREVLRRFRFAGLKLSPKKCNLFRREVAYLGHVISAWLQTRCHR